MKMTLNELKEKCAGCTKCGLCEGRTNVVFGYGKEDADIMLIGEGPGENEDLQGMPFVGRSGKLLDKFLAAVDLSREKNVYIANMVKCRPPKNRDPKPEEQEICIEWLREQFKVVRPKIIVCVGRISAQKLISPDFRVTKEHGMFIEKNGVLFMGTFHPAAILRNPNNKEAAFGDWLALREKIKELNINI
ncbi:MAG: uracil-DNA glycosylase [Eubacterium sp.]